MRNISNVPCLFGVFLQKAMSINAFRFQKTT